MIFPLALLVGLALDDLAYLDWPQLAESGRLPPARVCAANKRLALEYQAWLEDLASTRDTNAVDWLDLRREAQLHYAVWDWMNAAVGGECGGPGPDGYYLSGEPYQRWALQRVRDLLGYDAFYASRWPPPVPLWRLRDAD